MRFRGDLINEVILHYISDFSGSLSGPCKRGIKEVTKYFSRINHMGTRSRIIIHRSTKPNIYLWMHFDGYLDGQGRDLCSQLKSLLSKFSPEQLQVMVDELDIPNIDPRDHQSFNAIHFGDFIEGKKLYKQDHCNDVEYEYHIDFMSPGMLRMELLNYRLTFYMTQTMLNADFGRILNEFEEIARMSDRISHMRCGTCFAIQYTQPI